MVKNLKVELSLDELGQTLYKSGTTNAKEMHNKNHSAQAQQSQKRKRYFRQERKKSRIKKLKNLMEDEQGNLRNVKRKLPFEQILQRNTQRKAMKTFFFCDETTFWLNEKPVGKRTTQNKKIPFPKPKYPFKIHASTGICFNRKTSIHIFQENMTSQKYLEILQKILVPGAQRLYKRKKFLLVQDGERKHTAKICTDFLKQKRINYVKDWPGYSPGLNPIENIWALLKKRIREKYQKKKKI
ncbi:hypothetical protein ABPG72_019964 [Tetrahymena utriculariae]